jgi:hypothetical protein
MASKTISVEGVAGQCPLCHHPPIQHVPDGTGATCVVCAFLLEEALVQALRGNVVKIQHVCTLQFAFKLSQREREQAALADKGSYPPRTICAECDCYWEAHKGYLCPTGDSTFVPLLDKDQPFLVTH